MKSSALHLVSVCISLCGVGTAHAADITVFKLDNRGEALLITGTIQPGDGAKFRGQASKYDDGFVLLESEGGSLADAIDIGETIRLKGYATAVINGSSCNSACALIWLAGSPRALSRSARVGFHAAYSDSSGSPQESGVANAMVGRYLTLLNLPEKAVIFATSSPPSKLSWLTTSNYLSAGIDLNVMDDINFASERPKKATAPPPIMVVDTPPVASKKEESGTLLWRKLDAWSVYVDPSVNNGCFLLGAFDNDTVFRVGVNRSANDSYYVLFTNSAWQSLNAGQTYNLQFRFDSDSPWDVPATGKQMGGSTYLNAIFKDANFWNEFVSSKVLDITKNGESVTKISMAGAKRGFDELVACQKYEDAHTRPKDPFAE